MSAPKITFNDFMCDLKDRTPQEESFHQAVGEVVQDILPLVNNNAAFRDAALLQRLTEPDRIISFRVEWTDEDNLTHVNRGYRVQFNSAIGPYKGGLRFHPTVTPSVLKFLGFEQTFKNALTGLPMGGGKGGSDFNPKGHSEAEIMRFCQSFMLELYRHIGPDTDVPAGDINVGAREIGWLFGAYQKITNNFEGALTGKHLAYGGSRLRTEATGYGVVHFLGHMLQCNDDDIEGKTVVISGAGNVATYAAEQAMNRGAKVVTLSDSGGFIHDEDGLTQEKIDWVRDHKAKRGTSLQGYASEFGATWHEGDAPWCVECDVALPCATQNELDEDGVASLIENGCMALVEGANMPTTAKGRKLVRQGKLLFGPAKAANAGGVAVSGLEISQNRLRREISRDEVASILQDIMKDIHERCAEAVGQDHGKIDYAKGANIYGFNKIANAMLAQGVF